VTALPEKKNTNPKHNLAMGREKQRGERQSPNKRSVKRPGRTDPDAVTDTVKDIADELAAVDPAPSTPTDKEASNHDDDVAASGSDAGPMAPVQDYPD